MRGCVVDLAEEGLRYCNQNSKSCHLCLESMCNDQEIIFAYNIAVHLFANSLLVIAGHFITALVAW